MYFSYPPWAGAEPDPSIPIPPPGHFTVPHPAGRSRTHYAHPWSSSAFFYDVDPRPIPGPYHNPGGHSERYYTNPTRAADDTNVGADRDYVRPVHYPPPPRPPPQQPPHPPPQFSRRTWLEDEYFDMWDYVRMNGPIPGFPRPYRAHEFPPYGPHSHPPYPYPPGHPLYSWEAHERWARFKAWDRARKFPGNDEARERAEYQYAWEKRRRAWDEWEKRFYGRPGVAREGWYAPPPRRARSSSESGRHEDAWGRYKPRPEQRNGSGSGSGSGSSTDEWSWWRRMPPRPDRPPPPHTREHYAYSQSSSSSSEFETTLTDALAAYDTAWATFLSSTSNLSTDDKAATPLTFRTVPWPQHPAPRSIEDIDARKVRDFLGAGGKTLKPRLREALLRFHPDKIAPLLARIAESEDRARVAAACEAVTKCLGEMMRSATC